MVVVPLQSWLKHFQGVLEECGLRCSGEQLEAFKKAETLEEFKGLGWGGSEGGAQWYMRTQKGIMIVTLW